MSLPAHDRFESKIRRLSRLAFGTALTVAAVACFARATVAVDRGATSGDTLAAKSGGPKTIAANGTVTPGATGLPPGVPRFMNFTAPDGIADNVGEPSVGSNWKSEQTFSNSMFNVPNGGRAMLYGGFSPDLYRVTFNDCSSPADALWEAKPLLLASTPRAFGDPILFTDHDTGRTFVSQLEGLSPAGSTTDITDDDGDNFTPSEGSSLPSDVDHQTFGGGRYADPPPPTVTTYPHAVYYASQSVSDARAARSDDGGVTFGPAVPMYTINDCAGLHGHIKVSPKDGTVYVPNVGCGGALPFHDTDAKQSVIVSEDNGLTWSVRPIPDSTTHGNGNEQNTHLQTRDPSVTIDADGTVYFVYQAEDRLTEVSDPADKAGDTHPKVAVSHDKGLTWEPSVDVGASVLNGAPIRNATFVASTSGDGGRAAVAFFGTETGGNNWACGDSDNCSGDTGLFPRDPFAGVWYLYISTTFDGGKTWATQNVTPGDPIQRGGICGGSTCRNLLDFMDLQIDKEGRILVAGEDGCVGACVSGGPNTFSAKGFITRQSGGNRMIAQYDPVEPAVPGAPPLSGLTNATKTKVDLTWTPPDDGASAITGYTVYRRIGDAGVFTPIATVTDTKYTDTTFDPTANNYYHVTATNSIGEGPFCQDILPVVGTVLESACVAPGLTLLTDAAGDTSAAAGLVPTPAGPGMDLLSFQLAQPVAADGVVKLLFRINTDPGISPQPAGSSWYVSMQTPDGTVRGVHMTWKGSTPTFESYVAKGNTSGGVDGRFVDQTTVKPAEPESNYDAANGVIDIVVKASDLGLNPGDSIGGFNSAVTQTTDPAAAGAPAATATYDQMPDSLAYTAAYTVRANVPCASSTNLPPIAALSASPTTGPAPLTVNFDASASADPDAGDSIASYTFSFGDGTPDVTQASPKISHTYYGGGAFFVVCQVTDNNGQISSNEASLTIRTDATLLNISTRARVLTDDNVMIGGFIITGNSPKKIVVRALGPSLQSNGQPVPGTLSDPTLELHDQNAAIASNDDWKSDQQSDIEAAGLAPSDERESAIVKTLDPGAYTAVLHGKNGETGIALVEAYDIDHEIDSQLGNISTRAFCDTGDNAIIAGFIAGTSSAASTRVVVRGIGPSLKDKVSGTMDDPTIEVRDGNGNAIASNDNWQDSQGADIQATGLAPTNDAEAAVLLNNFDPGPYTAIVRGKNDTTGVGLVEIYNVP